MNAIVFGVGGSIAEAIISRLIKDGYRVVGVRVDGDPASKPFTDDVAYEETFMSLDNSQDTRDFTSQLNLSFDALVYAHSYFAMESRQNFDFAEWNRSLYHNLTAVQSLFSDAGKYLQDGASIAIVTSTEAFRGSFRAAAYSATKAAVHNLVMTAANNLGRRNIRVNAVAPGWIGGVMDTDDVFEMSKKITPLGRLGAPSEVASVVRFLLSGDASFVTGATIVVDGGYLGVDTVSKFEAESTPE